MKKQLMIYKIWPKIKSVLAKIILIPLAFFVWKKLGISTANDRIIFYCSLSFLILSAIWLHIRKRGDPIHTNSTTNICLFHIDTINVVLPKKHKKT